MARMRRPNLAGGFYHITQRGNYQQIIFRDDRDRLRYLGRLNRYRNALDYQVHAYCLMNNHVHLLIETRQANLSQILQRIMGSYTLYYNRRHERTGHLFQGRSKAFLLDTRKYFLNVSRYIHLNPVQAELVSQPENHPWSSFRHFLPDSPGKGWVTLDRTLSHFNGDRREYIRFVKDGIGHKPDFTPTEQVFLGAPDFIRRVKSRLGWMPDGDPPADTPSSHSRHDSGRMDPNRIFREVATVYNESPGSILKRHPHRNRLREARAACIYLLRTLTPLTLHNIGQLMGGIRRSAVSRIAESAGGTYASNGKLKTAEHHLSITNSP